MHVRSLPWVGLIIVAGCNGSVSELADTGLAGSGEAGVVLDGGTLPEKEHPDSGAKDSGVKRDGGPATDAAGGTPCLPNPETCNGLDEDCDGMVDEELSRSCTSACGSGTQECVDGEWASCTSVGAGREECNGVDDDCDGTVDEGLSQSCSSACGSGARECVGGEWSSCTAPAPTVEECNGLDDDCDGTVDEGLTRSCPNACGAGSQECVGGEWSRCTAPTPTVEECNGVDDDCDGTVDEALTRSCSTACGSGTETCVRGEWDACSAPAADPESCNLADDDCNGRCDDTTGCRVAVHRSVHTSFPSHFYTTSRPEARCCGFRVEHYDYYWLYAATGPDLVPLYRCLLADGHRMYTRSPSCEGSRGAELEDTLGYMATRGTCGATPLYRLRNGDTGDRLYTMSAAERDNAVRLLGYTYEGVLGHVFRTPSG